MLGVILHRNYPQEHYLKEENQVLLLLTVKAWPSCLVVDLTPQIDDLRQKTSTEGHGSDSGDSLLALRDREIHNRHYCARVPDGGDVQSAMGRTRDGATFRRDQH